jgi:hypothetical protein
VNKKKIFNNFFAILLCVLGIFLLFPKLIDYIPRIKISITSLLFGFASVLILFALIFKSQRGLFFPAVILILTGLFLIYRDEAFFPSFLDGIIILPLIVAIAFLSLLPFEPDKQRVLIPSITFFAIAGGMFLYQWKFKNISKLLSKYVPLKPIDLIAILLILWGGYRLFKS